MEKTLVIIKPDGLQRRLVGRVISRFEEKGFRMAGLKMVRLRRETAEELYRAHRGKEFYEPLVRFITSAPVVLVVLEAKDACRVARKMLGATLSSEAEPGTVRGDFALSNRFNLVHGSDDPEKAEEEIRLLFEAEEIHTHESPDKGWVYDLSGGDVV